jgi:hypothetical protein
LAGACPQTSDAIDTDRPDTTNSAIVVPEGSLQNENGVNISRIGADEVFDGTNSRLRLGVSPCLELLVDLPNYVGVFEHRQASGFGDVAPAVKWQISPAPGKFDLSAVVGAALPTGAREIAGPGVQPYLQFPWSIELAKDWSLNGMETEFFTPSDPSVRSSNQSTISLERETTEQTFLFVEYVGTFPDRGASSQLFNWGGGYRMTQKQQIDFHISWGLDRNAPTYVLGVGYSFRLDHFL